ncbi:DUF3658 domain-containing protein [Lentilactobacillus diolivorans]|uniref:DUF1835 domain-containing protein n=2 Tax=Lentilactobacillus diolivorans TaxID=179838 RepID=A0A0R1S6L8_9LACO|nr:DUF3658 domain-containing protein [Lentilactobacillus diolivorans]KRL64524.1 hypothetical protein FC85_GL001034 [Lentilactobacillus diolivorans DSM 14421]GEP22907.1 hypothetical protein LDI01_05000 [Lentilactobacillus diolivorans]
MIVDITFGTTFGHTLAHYYRLKHQQSEVIALPLALDFGEINQDDILASRQKTFEMMASGFHEQQLKDALVTLRQALQQLKTVIKRGDTLRIWWDESSANYCGFLWLCQQLSTIDNPVYQIKLPLVFPTPEVLIAISSIDELADQDIDKFNLFSYQQSLPKLIRRSWSYAWRSLRDDNRVVRIVLNGHVLSQPITFYDQFILSTMDTVHFIKVEQLLAKILGTYGSGFGSQFSEVWYRYRLHTLASQGMFEIKTDKKSSKTTIRLKLPK